MPKKIKQTDSELELEVPSHQQADTVEEKTSLVGDKTEGPISGIFDQEGELVVDVFETNSDFVVSAAIAGIQIKDLDISLEKDMMVIKGNRCDPHIQQEDKRYFYQECYWGPFSRKIILPENIDIDKADAQIDKGILTVKIPKNEITDKAKLGIKVS